MKITITNYITDPQIKVSDLTERVRAIIDDNLEVLLHNQQNMELLKPMLQNGQIHFIGLEVPNTDISNLKKFYEYLFQKSGPSLARIADPVLRELTLLFLGDDVWSLRAQEPKLFSTVEIIGLDNHRDTDEEERRYTELWSAFDALDLVIKHHSEIEPNHTLMDQFLTYYGELRNSAEKPFELSDAEIHVKKIFPTHMQEPVMKIFKALKPIVEFDHIRDQHMTQDLLATKGNGVYIVGAQHLRSLNTHYSKICNSN